jgi:hypothetical protein
MVTLIFLDKRLVKHVPQNFVPPLIIMPLHRIIAAELNLYINPTHIILIMNQHRL